MTDLNYKGTGSTLTASEWNVLADKITSGADSIFTGSVVMSGTNVMQLSPAGTGSVTSWGKWVQAGSSATDAGSNVWVSFGTAFTSTPYIIVSCAQTLESIVAPTGSWNAGSFYVETTSASQTFSWMAVG